MGKRILLKKSQVAFMNTMNNHYITKESDCLTINRKEYASQLSFSSSRIRQDKKIELDMKQEYSGRELYEMIQNADDEGSPKIELVFTDDNHFHIKNWGERPFSEGGLLSIMRSFLSPKTHEAYKDAAVRPIGNKGLGFRSLLNWSDKIIVHSNGVQCSFSKEIAKREWDKLKNEGLKADAVTQKEILDFESERPNHLPLPILSIPEVSDDAITRQGCFDINGACTTDIEVVCSESSVLADIASKLSTLPCSVLLFLRNIAHIEIYNKGEIRTIKKIDTEILDEDLERITISDNGDNISFIVCKYQAENKTYEVGVAYALTSFSYDHYLYSYFPTQVSLSVPAIYHGTFELNASRNHLVESLQNRGVLEKLGEVAVKLSTCLAGRQLLNDDKWAPFKILNFTSAEMGTAMLSSLGESIRSYIGSAQIFPLVNATFSSMNVAMRLGDKMAVWLSGNRNILPEGSELNNHLDCIEPGIFSTDKYLSAYILDEIDVRLRDVADSVKNIARQPLSVSNRADFIDAIVDCGPTNIPLSILIDADGALIDGDKDNPAYVLTMVGNVVLPQCLGIRSVDAALVDELKNKWNLQIVRQVTEQLKKVTSVMDGDHTAIRRKIESWSKKEMNYAGMCEVMKWEFEYPSQDGTAFSSDLNLLNREGVQRNACALLLDEPTFPRELLSKVGDKWLLADDLATWKKILGAETDDEVADFLYKKLGVSKRVPSDHIYFGDNEDYLDTVRNKNNKIQIGTDRCNNFGENNRVTKTFNYSYVPNADFLSKYSLTEAVGLILKDERVLTHVMNNNINLVYHTVKSETVSCSYSAYKLKNSVQFSPLQNTVINSANFGCDVDYNYLENVLSLNRTTQIDPLLVTLGAQTNISNLTTDQLYVLLSRKTDSAGIQKCYKELREAIRNKNENEQCLSELRSKHLTHVWARIGGQLVWKPVEEVYYWDNDQLPQVILSALPKLEIGNRVGEDSVAKIFGVKLAKNIELSFSDSVENESLLPGVKKYFSERIKYFLAYRIGDDVKDSKLIRQSVNALKGLYNNLYIYISAKYKFGDAQYNMEEGDILTSLGNDREGMRFYICSSHHCCIEAIAAPAFCENLNEAVCMALKVTSNTMANYFRNIITHDLRYIEYIAQKDISPEIWTLTLKSFGITEYEQRFWQQYSDMQTVKLDVSQLAEHVTDARAFICGIYPHLSLPETYTGIEDLSASAKYRLLRSMSLDDCTILGEDGLRDFYQAYCKSIRDGYMVRYNTMLYGETSGKIAADSRNVLSYVEEYRKKCLEFSEPFFDEQINAIKFQLITESQLDEMLDKLMYEKFQFSCKDSKLAEIKMPETILPEYEKLLDEFHLSEGSLNQTDALIAKFKGLEELFRVQLEKYIGAVAHEDGLSEGELYAVSIEVAQCHSVLRDINSDDNQSMDGKSSDGYRSDKSKYSAGKKAEIKTFEAMKLCGDYEDVQGCSRILNKECGNDKLHYDICYRKNGSSKTDVRYLEVKNGNPFFMSWQEYQFALAHCEDYDLAIVHDNKISIVECPFSSKNGRRPLEVQPDTYLLTVEWD